MIEGAKAIADRLNSPSDWAIVGSAAVTGAAVDGAINLLPMPFFSPGVCALLAAGGALSLKRGAEAFIEGRRANRRHRKLLVEGNRCIDQLAAAGRDQAAEDLHWEIEFARDNPTELESIVREAREDLKKSTYEKLGSRGLLISPGKGEWMQAFGEENRSK